jgi:uncharacterized repeat protein (TIGR03803 family)
MGRPPREGLAGDGLGNLYGTTAEGGSGTKACPGVSIQGQTISLGGCGVVFKLDRSGNETVLYNFTGGTDGAFPSAGLVLDLAGNLYGTTWVGGDLTASACPGSSFTGYPPGCGVVFKLDPTGKETVLYRFTGGADGSQPAAGLVWDRAGNLYGTTQGGGSTSGLCGPGPPTESGCGVVFKLDPTGKETVLYTFTGGADGAQPTARLVWDRAGNLYGTTRQGGITTGVCAPTGCGVVFKLEP